MRTREPCGLKMFWNEFLERRPTQEELVRVAEEVPELSSKAARELLERCSHPSKEILTRFLKILFSEKEETKRIAHILFKRWGFGEKELVTIIRKVPSLQQEVGIRLLEKKYVSEKALCAVFFRVPAL